MTRAFAVAGLGIIAVAFLANDFASALGISDFLQTPTSAPPMLFRWWDLARSAITLLAVALLAWVTLRSRTANVLKEELSATRDRADRLADDYKTSQARLLELEKEVTALRARTDLSEVMKLTQDMLKHQDRLLEMKRTNDLAITELISKAVTEGDKKYTQLGDSLSKMLTFLGDQGKETVDQARKNHEAIQSLLKSFDSLSRRFGSVEKGVQEVARQTGSDADADASTQDPDERRRRTR